MSISKILTDASTVVTSVTKAKRCDFTKTVSRSDRCLHPNNRINIQRVHCMLGHFSNTNSECLHLRNSINLGLLSCTSCVSSMIAHGEKHCYCAMSQISVVRLIEDLHSDERFPALIKVATLLI